MAAAPTWGDFSIQSYGTYLGFALGPGSKGRSWEKALLKMQDRARIWRDIGGGFLVSLSAYRTYILPVAGFLLQLEGLPVDWPAWERRICNLLFPGPRGWMSPQFLMQLKDVGVPVELPCAATISLAAKCRVHRWEGHQSGGLDIDRRSRRLGSLVGQAEISLGWLDWADNALLHNLERAQNKLERRAHESGASVEALLRGGDAAQVPRERWQRRCVDVFQHREAALLHRHLRRQLDRFRLSTLPGRRVDRAMLSLQGLKNKVPPCVWAAVLRALCDGWTTGARMSSTRDCLFQCGRGQDSLHLYVHCPVVEQLALSRARLAPARPGWKLDDSCS